MRRWTKAELSKLDQKVALAEEFLCLTGRIAEGDFLHSFDPGFAFARENYRGDVYHIPTDVLESIVDALRAPSPIRAAARRTK